MCSESNYNDNQRKTMLDIAYQSILHGLKTNSALVLDPLEFEPELQKQRACFVTLNKNEKLRGCIGHLEAIQPLIADVATNSYSAAFQDPRFSPVTPDEITKLVIHISILTPAVKMTFENENELLAKLRPGIDGLILQEKHHKGTFLPAVWESLPEPASFLNQLKVKAGLSMNYWSNTLEVLQYETESFARQPSG